LDVGPTAYQRYAACGPTGELALSNESGSRPATQLWEGAACKGYQPGSINRYKYQPSGGSRFTVVFTLAESEGFTSVFSSSIAC